MMTVGWDSSRRPLRNAMRSAQLPDWLRPGFLVLTMSAQPNLVAAEDLTSRWAVFYHLCTVDQRNLEETAVKLMDFGWQREKWPEHALETARQGAMVTFFPRWPSGKEEVEGVILGLDQLRDPEYLPSNGLAFSDPETGDRAYLYMKDHKQLCSFVSLDRMVDPIFAEIGVVAPNVRGIGRDGIHRTEDLYVMVRQLTHEADDLMPPDFPFRTNFFTSLDLNQSESTP
jgi:hypothetical protein